MNKTINIDISNFINNHWQKQPLLIRQAIADFQNPVSPEVLAGLSLESNIESRIILEQARDLWELRHGPFSGTDYASLPESKWTLLVQAVDHWLPEVHKLQDFFCFLPSWRMDDIMISYATDGGSVGPHYDYYDVFLLQAQGKRLWKIGPEYDDTAELLNHHSLKILSNFKTTEEYLLEPGDVLYLPPGVGHHGIAQGECVTISIGFRAPSHRDILMQFTDFVADRLPEQLRYSDPDLTKSELPFYIDDTSIDRIQAIFRQYVDDRELLSQWFGELMTQPKFTEANDENICNSWHELIVQANPVDLELALGARVARNHNLFFANGMSFELTHPETEQLAHKIAERHELSFTELAELNEKQSKALMMKLINQQVMILKEYKE